MERLHLRGERMDEAVRTGGLVGAEATVVAKLIPEVAVALEVEDLTAVAVDLELLGKVTTAVALMAQKAAAAAAAKAVLVLLVLLLITAVPAVLV